MLHCILLQTIVHFQSPPPTVTPPQNHGELNKISTFCSRLCIQHTNWKMLLSKIFMRHPAKNKLTMDHYYFLYTIWIKKIFVDKLWICSLVQQRTWKFDLCSKYWVLKNHVTILLFFESLQIDLTQLGKGILYYQQ